MTKCMPSLLAASMLALAFHADPAHAQSRVFVAAQGLDSNPCTFAQPCRTFQHAHDVVTAGGEIDVLDPAGYGVVTITKAISIQGHGFAGIGVSGGGTGITVSAADTDKINLNGLLIDGTGVGIDGIHYLSGQLLSIENCIVRNLTADGLRFNHSNNTIASLTVSNSYFTDNGQNGILVEPTNASPMNGTLDRVTLSGNASAGLDVVGSFGTGPLRFAVTDSVAANNGAFGFAAHSLTSQSAVNLVLTRSTASGNGTGIAAVGVPATLWLAQSTVTENSTGYQVSSGAIMSYGDNYIDVNDSNSGLLSIATKQ